MESINTIKLLQFTIGERNMDVIIYRSFKNVLKGATLPIFTNKRLRYKHFCFAKAKKIILTYTTVILDYNNDMIFRLKAMKKLYNYILIFISDIFKYSSAFALNGIYTSATNLINELNRTNIQPDLINLKKIVKNSMQKVINAIRYICKNNTNILIRLPYSIFSEITNYDIFKIYSEYDGAILDKAVAKKLNNIFKLDIIPIFIKKINIYIILYIIKYLAFKELSYNTIEQIDNSGHLVIKNRNLIEIIT